MRPTVVVAPGAFVTDAKFWFRPLADLLEPHGIPVRAVDLPSCGNTKTVGTFADDVAAMRKAIGEVDGPVLLGGHSYGGLVITEAGAGLGHKVRHLLYLSGIVGDKCIIESDYVPPGEAPETQLNARLGGVPIPVPKAFMSASTGDNSAWSRLCYGLGRQGMRIPGMHVTVGEGKGSAAFKSNELKRLDDTAMIPDALRRITRQSLSSFLEGPKRLAYKEIPSTYFLGLKDGEVPRPQLDMQASRCTTVIEVPTNHFCHLDRPDLVAEVVVKLADEIDAGVPAIESVAG